MVLEPGSTLTHSRVACAKTFASARRYDAADNWLALEHSTLESGHNKPVRARSRQAGKSWIELGRTNRRR